MADKAINLRGLGKLTRFYEKIKGDISEANNYAVVLFAADNGICRERTSAYPPGSAAEIIDQHLKGLAPTAYFLKRIGKPEYLIDVGICSPTPSGCLDYKIKLGTGNFLGGDVLTAREVEKAFKYGSRVWDEISGNYFDIIGVGEIGPGNTLCAAAITTVITGAEPARVVGRGSSEDKVISKKIDIISRALQIRGPDSQNPVDNLVRFGGLEIAALTGFIIRAAQMGKMIMLDGFVTAVAAMLAAQIDRKVIDYIIVPSQSLEPGHSLVLEQLGKYPVLDLELNYGEGLAAAIGLSLADMITGYFCITV
ncbi:nicotinate-nucleotide--dimethylbenzimidazole phosphoribosyltransferase [Syntrophomonas erecta]